MRNQIILLFCVASLGLLSVGCDKDDDIRENEVTAKVSSILRSGTWKITRYKDDGLDRTTLLSEYIFQFEAGNVLRANRAENSYTGNWSVTLDDDRSTDLDLNLFFSSTADLRLINDDWQIINYTENRIEAGDDVGDIDEDLIIFERQ